MLRFLKQADTNPDSQAEEADRISGKHLDKKKYNVWYDKTCRKVTFDPKWARAREWLLLMQPPSYRILCWLNNWNTANY